MESYRLGKRIWECTLTLHTVQSIQYKVHGTQYTIQEHSTYTIQSSQNKYTVQVHSQVRSKNTQYKYTLKAHSTQCTLHCTQYTFFRNTKIKVHSTNLYIMQQLQYTVYSTQYTVHITQNTVHSYTKCKLHNT